MRRAPIVLTTTAVGFAATLSFQAREPELGAAVAASTRPAPSGATGSGSAPASSTSAGSGSTGSTGATGPATPAPISGTFTGAAIDTRYGSGRVRVTLTDGRITDVEALQLPANKRKSVEISSAAEPRLRASALERQSADVDAVSGATVTTAAYEASLQSALDKAGFEATDGSRGTNTIPEVEESDGPQ